MRYSYLNLRFNDHAKKPSENLHKVTYESWSTELHGKGVIGRDAKQRYSLLGKDEKGRKVAFYITRDALRGLKPGETYEFRLSGNMTEGAYNDREPRREFGVCRTRPKPAR
jgi:hypothetical protein